MGKLLCLVNKNIFSNVSNCTSLIKEENIDKIYGINYERYEDRL